MIGRFSCEWARGSLFIVLMLALVLFLAIRTVQGYRNTMAIALLRSEFAAQVARLDAQNAATVEMLTSAVAATAPNSPVSTPTFDLKKQVSAQHAMALKRITNLEARVAALERLAKAETADGKKWWPF